MKDKTSPTVEAAADTPDAPLRPRRLGRLVLRSCGYVLILCAICVVGLIFYMKDRPVQVPPSLRTEIEARVAAAAPHLDIVWGDLIVTVQEGWRPKLQVRDLRIGGADGEEILALSEVEADFSMRALLRGKVRPKTLRAAGMFATLRRDSDGQVSVRASAAPTAPARQAATLPDLVNGLDAVFVRSDFADLTSVDLDAVTLRFEDARARRAWTIDGARLRLERDGKALALSADLAILGGGAAVATMEANYASDIGTPAAQFGVTIADVEARDIAAFNPAFGWLEALRAPISGALRGGVDSAGALTPVNATLQIGEGVLQPTTRTRPIPFRSARTYFSYTPGSDELVFDEVRLDSDWASGSAEGQAVLRGVSTGRLEQLTGQLRISGLRLDPPGLYDQPLQLDGAEIDFRLVPKPFRVDIGQLRLVDAARTLLFDGHVTAAEDGWQVALDGHLAEITPDRLMDLWPNTLTPRTRGWLQENVTRARLSDIEFALRSRPDARPDLYLGFAFDEADVRFMPSMPPITQAKGVGELLRNRLVLTVETGQVAAEEGGEIDVAGSAFVIPDTTVKGGTPAEVSLRTDSSITAALSLLNREPLGILKRAGLPANLADGQAKANAAISFPLAPKVATEDIAYDVTARLTDVQSDRLVEGSTISASALDVTATPEQVEITGKGTFDGVPFDTVWWQDLGPTHDGASSLSAEVEISPSTIANLNLGLPPGMVSGKGTGTLDLSLPAGAPPTYSLASNLTGIGLSVPELGWSKARGRAGKLRVAGQLGEALSVDRLELEAPGLSAEGTVSLRTKGGLEAATFSRVRVGGWLDAPVTLIGRGPGASPAVQVRGGRLDMRNASFGSGSGSGSGSGNGGPLTLALNRLQITDTIAVTDMRGDFSLARGLQGSFTGNVNGSASIQGQVLPDQGRSAFRIASQDAGAVFAAAGLLKQARGGDMSLVLQPVGTAGGFNGSLNIQNTRVKDAPAIAALFNALSVVGLIEQMGGQGLHFAEVEAAFRLTPERVTLTQASAVGPSIGLSMDGTYDVNTSQMDMRGVFSPIYIVNGIGSILTRKGEGLIGFNFRLSGPASGPKVQVNPLSALTPSIFREIFRRPPPTLNAEPGEQPGAAPKLQSRDPGANREEKDPDLQPSR